jgi:hypothetical protein
MGAALDGLHVAVEVAQEDDGPLGADHLAPARERPVLQGVLHEVDARPVREPDARRVVEGDAVPERDQPALAGGEVDEELGHRRLAAGDELAVGAGLLEDEALAGAAGPQLDRVEGALDLRDETREIEQPAAVGPAFLLGVPVGFVHRQRRRSAQ